MESVSHNTSDILEAALDSAFSAQETNAEVKGASDAPVASPPPIMGEQKSDGEPPSISSSSSASDDSWKEEYEAHVRSWRAQSADQREKAEKERARWEAIRAQEKVDAVRRKATSTLPFSSPAQEGWQRVGVPGAADTSSSSLVDLAAEIDNSTRSRAETGVDELHKWEDVPSDTSSFPSLSFEANPPPPAESSASKAPVSVTLSIFDSSLSTRTRLLALASSLAVNLLLPFINGVMLGFGEIFAKNVIVGWFGWKKFSIANVGLRSNSRSKPLR